MILSIRSSFKKLLVLQRDYLMVLGEKHGTNYLPYTFFLVYNEKERKRKERQPFQIWIELTEEIIQRMQSENLY